MKKRICKSCKKEYAPSSKHLKCPQCRHFDKKVACSTCGNKKTPKAKVCKKCSQNNGKSNNHWKGGKTKHNKGYALVFCPNHPRVKNRSNSYVMEHILVMEGLLNRYLFKHEQVHHKNGIKNDNRPENLELWTKNHPVGSRVEDLLKWAHEFIELYEKSNKESLWKKNK